MTSSAFKTISTVAWSTLYTAIVLLFFVAAFAPETRLVRNSRERDERIRSIESSDDLRQVQATATLLLHAGYATSSTASIICRVFLSALLISIIGSAITIWQLRRIRKGESQMNTQQPNLIASYEPPPPVSISGGSVHRTLDSMPAPGSGGGR